MFDPETCTPEQYEEISKITRRTLLNTGGSAGRMIAHGLDPRIVEGCLMYLESRGSNGVDVGLGVLLCLAAIDHNRDKEIVI